MVVKDVRNDMSEKDYKSSSDRELIQMFSEGDKRAFDEFYKRYFNNLMRFVMSYCGNKNLAEDVVQDIFVKLLGFKIKTGIVRNIKSYIYSSALNRCRDIAKRDHKALNLNDAQESMAVSYDRNIERLDIEIMNKFIERLPTMQKEVLLLRTKSGLSFGEIGLLLDISENSAKVNYFYALTNLRRMMGGMQNE